MGSEKIVAIEGITPTMLWTALAVLVAAASVFLLVDKVANVFRERQKRKEEIIEKQRQEIAKACTPSSSVDERMKHLEQSIEQINDSLSEINRKLDRDNRRINDLEHGQSDMGEGFRAMCQASVALLNHGISDGNTDEMQDAKNVLMNYLGNRWSYGKNEEK